MILILLVLVSTIHPSAQFRTFVSTVSFVQRSKSHLQMNFFKEFVDKAFENDPNLPSNKSQRQIDSADDNLRSPRNNFVPKTEVQRRWLEQQDSLSRKNAGTATQAKGAPMNPLLLVNTSWKLNLYLTGTPDFDPSNSLYGSRVNISNRNRQQGFAIGADVLPEEPTVTIKLQLLENGECTVEPSSFTTGEKRGQWRLSEDRKFIRISIDVIGFKRTVTTKGTIQNIYWSEREVSERKSSATYSIPSGFIYAEAPIEYANLPGVYSLAESVSGKDGPVGILKLEKDAGLFGAGSKLLPCGKFSGQMIVESE